MMKKLYAIMLCASVMSVTHLFAVEPFTTEEEMVTGIMSDPDAANASSVDMVSTASEPAAGESVLVTSEPIAEEAVIATRAPLSEVPAGTDVVTEPALTDVEAYKLANIRPEVIEFARRLTDEDVEKINLLRQQGRGSLRLAKPSFEEDLQRMVQQSPEEVALMRRLTEDDMKKIDQAVVKRFGEQESNNTMHEVRTDDAALAEQQAQAAYLANPSLYSGIVKALLATDAVAFKRLYDLLSDVTTAFRASLTPEQTKEVLEIVALLESAMKATASAQGTVSVAGALKSAESLNALRIKLLPYTFVAQDTTVQWPSREKLGVQFKYLAQMMIAALKVGEQATSSMPDATAEESAVSEATADMTLGIPHPKKMAPEIIEKPYVMEEEAAVEEPMQEIQEPVVPTEQEAAPVVEEEIMSEELLPTTYQPSVLKPSDFMNESEVSEIQPS